MRKLLLNTLKVAGAVSILFFATKDTGTVLEPVQVKNETGVEVTFQEGEAVNILRESPRGYIVEKDGAKVEIERPQVLLMTKKSSSFKVRRISPLKADIASIEVKRILLEGEAVTVQKNEGLFSLVLTEDNLTGYVLTEDLEREVVDHINIGNLTDVFTTPDGSQLPSGTLLIVKAYQSGAFTCVDQSGRILLVPKEKLSLGQSEKAAISRGLSADMLTSASGIVDKAKEFLGMPYAYGSTGPNAFDCSGFTSYVYRLMGYQIPRSSVTQSNYGMPVSRDALMPGDLIFFNTSGAGVSHVAMYIGDGKFIHAASSPINKVTINSLSEAYYSSRYVTARRPLR